MAQVVIERRGLRQSLGDRFQEGFVAHEAAGVKQFGVGRIAVARQNCSASSTDAKGFGHRGTPGLTEIWGVISCVPVFIRSPPSAPLHLFNPGGLVLPGGV